MVKNIDVIAGCQYGSESKGLVASMVAEMNKYDWFVSVNSSQAGHTAPHVGEDGVLRHIVTRQLPSAVVSDAEEQTCIYLGAGAVINLEVLLAEIRMLEMYGIGIKDRLFIDENATVITEDCIQEEISNNLQARIGSTCEGVGVALARKAYRTGSVMRDHKHWCANYGITLVKNSMEVLSGNILLEGSQGFGLSPFYGHYPFCTSRDTTVASFLSYAQLNPKKLGEVYGVYRTYPIRVGGNSGDMVGELTWEDIDRKSGYKGLGEMTTVTQRLRRIGNWDSELARRAYEVNGVTRPVLTFVNYLSKDVEGVTDIGKLPAYVVQSINRMALDVGGFWYAISTAKYGGWIITE